MAARHGKGEGSIFYDDARQRWVAQATYYAEGKRKRKWVSAKTREEAAKKLRQVLGHLDQGLLPANEKQTVGQFLTRWLDDVAKPTVRSSTYESYVRLVRLHITPHLGRLPLAKLSPHDLARLYRLLLDQGLSPRTVQYVHAVLHRALDQAARWNLIARNPADLVDAPRPKRPEIAPLTAEQAKTLIETAKGERLEALYVVALASEPVQILTQIGYNILLMPLRWTFAAPA